MAGSEDIKIGKNLKIDRADLQPVRKNEQFINKLLESKNDVHNFQSKLKTYSGI